VARHRQRRPAHLGLYLAGRKDEAIAAVPNDWVDLKSLVGRVDAVLI
jgi:hypothetical protein